MSIEEHIENIKEEMIMAKCIDTDKVFVDMEDLEPVMEELDRLRGKNKWG